jgi:hypothetical protein
MAVDDDNIDRLCLELQRMHGAVPRIAYASHLENTDTMNSESHLHQLTDDADRLDVSPSLLHPALACPTCRVQSSTCSFFSMLLSGSVPTFRREVCGWSLVW